MSYFNEGDLLSPKKKGTTLENGTVIESGCSGKVLSIDIEGKRYYIRVLCPEGSCIGSGYLSYHTAHRNLRKI